MKLCFAFILSLSQYLIAAVIKNGDFYDAIEAKYQQVIHANPKLSKYKYVIYRHIEKIVRDNVEKATDTERENNVDVHICTECGFVYRIQEFLIHSCR